MTDYEIEKYRELGLSARINGAVLQELPAVSHMWSNDLFLVSRPENASTVSAESNIVNEYFEGRFIVQEEPDRRFLIDENTGTAYSAPRTSYAVRYADLCASVVKDTRRRVEIGSLGREQSADYALSSHTHDDVYSWLSAVSFFPENDETRFWHVGTLVVSSYSESGELSVSEIELNCPKATPPRRRDPDVGTMRFVAARELTSYPVTDCGGVLNVDIYSNAFDGWVYPNGATFVTEKDSDFAAAKAAYQSTGSQFTVPDARHFVKCNARPTGQPAIQLVNYQNGLAPHGHEINGLTCDGNVSIDKIEVRAGFGDGSTGTHVVCGYGDAQKYRNDITTHVSGKMENAKLDGLATKPSDASLDVETKPTRNLMPVMVFIGRKDGE